MVANSLITVDKIASEALMHLDNELTLAQNVNRDYESDYAGPQKPGATIRIRRPVRGTVRTGATRVVQDVEEGNTALTVATQIGADLDFSSVDMTLSIEKFSERYIKPQMVVIANRIDTLLWTELVNNVNNWVGTPGQTVNSFSDFYLGQTRLDQLSVPSSDRIAIMSPIDHGALLGSQTGLYISDVAKTALQRGKLGKEYGGAEIFMSQNVKTHTNGTWSGSSPIAEIDNGTLSVAYSAAKESWSMTIHIDGLTSTTGTVLIGDVFTIENVYAVNQITGETLPHLQMFVVRESVTADGTGDADVVISPPIITSGPYKTCNAAAVDGANIVLIGSVNTGYAQNIIMHKNTITMATPPMFEPKGAGVSGVSSKTYKGISMRVIEGYDFNNDLPGWRFDLLFGCKCTEPHLATKLSGTS